MATSSDVTKFTMPMNAYLRGIFFQKRIKSFTTRAELVIRVETGSHFILNETEQNLLSCPEIEIRVYGNMGDKLDRDQMAAKHSDGGGGIHYDGSNTKPYAVNVLAIAVTYQDLQKDLSLVAGRFQQNTFDVVYVKVDCTQRLMSVQTDEICEEVKRAICEVFPSLDIEHQLVLGIVKAPPSHTNITTGQAATEVTLASNIKPITNVTTSKTFATDASTHVAGLSDVLQVKTDNKTRTLRVGEGSSTSTGIHDIASVESEWERPSTSQDKRLQPPSALQNTTMDTSVTLGSIGLKKHKRSDSRKTSSTSSPPKMKRLSVIDEDPFSPMDVSDEATETVTDEPHRYYLRHRQSQHHESQQQQQQQHSSGQYSQHQRQRRVLKFPDNEMIIATEFNLGRAISYQIETKLFSVLQYTENALLKAKENICRQQTSGKPFTNVDKMLFEIKGLYSQGISKLCRTKRDMYAKTRPVPRDLMNEILNMEDVVGCGRVYSRLEVHVKDNQADLKAMREKIMRCLKKYRLGHEELVIQTMIRHEHFAQYSLM